MTGLKKALKVTSIPFRLESISCLHASICSGLCQTFLHRLLDWRYHSTVDDEPCSESCYHRQNCRCPDWPAGALPPGGEPPLGPAGGDYRISRQRQWEVFCQIFLIRAYDIVGNTLPFTMHAVARIRDVGLEPQDGQPGREVPGGEAT